ncbi:MAG: tRNA pseudouridine(55) synthase TruB [Blastocatellia bacterium]|nr:tRNA pseudouridine(55) synthase TruB [Blastocatellia bacterium]
MLKLPLHGGLLIDKPIGMTSHDVVARLRHILRNKRIGHTGTLDPFATGLLLICLGHCTRLSQFLTGKDKSYEATIRFGYATTTQDYTGSPITLPKMPEDLTEEQVQTTLQTFLGLQQQIPPMFSAKKLEGISLHKLARQGQVVFRAAVPIQIHSLEIVPTEEGKLLRSGERGFPEALVKVSCSAGTYIRTLAHDLGEKLGCGAHLTALRRTRIGPFSLEQAVTIQHVADLMAIMGTEECILKPVELLPDWPRFQVDAEVQLRFRYGQPIPVPAETDVSDLSPNQPFLAVCDEAGELLGIARFDAAQAVARPQVVFAD